MLKVVQSNRVENLAAELLRTQAEAPLADPLAEEVVVVQSPGMALWLRTEQARAFGIAAGVGYPLPSLFAWRLIRTLVPAPVEDPYAKRSLRWTLFGLLAALPSDSPEFAPLRHYLEGGEQALKRFQLAERIADLFDQYLVYRPSWLAAWGRGQRLGLPGPHEAWQSALWAQAVAALGAVPDRAALLSAALERLAQSPPGSLDDLLAPVAPRVALFGLSALPPGQLALFTALARHRPVTLYFLNPSADYWAEVLRPAVVARRQAEALKGGGAEALEAYEAAALAYLPAHPLLAQNGALGRQFLNQLLALDGAAEVLDHFGEGDEDTALAQLQQAVLLWDDAPLVLTSEDPSLRFLPCPSPLREIEVLYDALVDAFEADATLRPQDVVVMIPDIDHYAPLIEAVFGRPEVPLALPYSIADRQGQEEAPLLAWLSRLLALPASRFERSTVMALLALPQCQRAFGLAAEDLSLFERWLEGAEVRWGWDGQDWAATGLSEADVVHSWRRGLDRLLLGAMTGDAEGVFSGLAPVALAEGEGGRLSALLVAVETLARFRDRLAGPCLPAEWAAVLGDALQSCLALSPEDELVLAPLREALSELLTLPEAVASSPLPRLALLEALKSALEGPGTAHRFFAGGVTFCTLMPMRVLPFRIVGLVGMNEDAYPRLEQPLPFDLMAQAPRPGDRLRRSEDRYLFLEALLSARDRVILSWTARDRNYRPLPPSLLVTELQAALSGEVESTAMEKALGPITVAPPLQPFSSRYGAAGLETYQSLWRPRREGKEGPEARLELPVPDAESAPLGSGESRAPALLLAFYRDPLGAYFREGLGAALRRLPDSVEDDEPFALDSLSRYRLLEDSFTLAGGDAVLRARGRLPLGAAGDGALAEAQATTQALRRALPEAFWAATAAQVPLDLTLPSGRLLGPCLRWSDGLVRAQRFGALRAQDRLGLWITVLLYAAAGWGRHGVLLGPDKAAVVTAPEAPEVALESLLGLLQAGLSEPLPLFPEASCTWAEAVRDGKAGDEKFASLGAKWRPERARGPIPEGLTLAARHAFPHGLTPVRASFCALAEQVFMPLLEAESGVPLGEVRETLEARGGLAMTRFDPHRMPLAGRKLLEASAGTGKTFALGSLVLRAVLGQQAPQALDAPALRIDEILMVTFTRAATAELRDRLGQRLRGALQAFLDPEPPKDAFLAQLWNQSVDRLRDQARLRAALGQLDEAPVFTIHGFCHRALLEGALEQATPFTFENLEDDKALHREALRTAWRQGFYSASASVQALWLRVWAEPEKCERLFSGWLAPGALTFQGVPEDDLDALGAALAQALAALRAAWARRDEDPAVLGLPAFGKAGTGWGALTERYNARSRGPGKPGLQGALDAALGAEAPLPEALKALLGEGKKKNDPGVLEAFTPAAFADTAVKKGQSTVSGGALATAAEALLAAAEAFEAGLTHRLFRAFQHALATHKDQRQLRGPEDALRQLAASLRGPSGEALAERLRIRYPLAFIDEFQDTDPVQLDIFEALYPVGGSGTLVLIGDPKQAIYGFRGADLFAYLRARQALPDGDRLRMDQNWRSSPPVIEALNGFYQQQSDPFLSEAMGFEPVTAAKRDPAQPWARNGAPAPALGFYRSTAVGSDEAQAHATVALLQRLLAEATIEGAPLKPQQCALLVNTHNEGARLQRCLRAAGLGSAFASKQSVFATETAEDVFRVLRAMAAPEDGGGLRDALLTPLLAVAPAALVGADALAAHQARFRSFRERWERQGVLTALFALLEAYAVPARCLGEREGPRVLTDLRHLGECLERFDRAGGGAAETLRAFTQAREAGDDNEAHQQRLESDENLVKIITVHGAKGLEYDVVLLPFPRKEQEETFPLFHDPAVGAMAVDLRKGPRSQAASTREKLGESLRLLYVALTRACHAVYVGVPEAKGKQSEAAQQGSALAHALGLQGLAPKAWDEAIAAAGWPLEVFDPAEASTVAAAPGKGETLAPAKVIAPRSFAREARVSYSSLLRQDMQAHAEPAGFGDEGRDAPVLERPTPLSPPAAQFPAGAIPGVCLHDMLESWPEGPEALPAHLERCLRRHGLWGAPGVSLEGVESWLSAVRATPIIEGRALADIPQQRAELAFDLRLKGFALPTLEGLIREAGYPMPSLPEQTLTGFLRGFIDVVLAVEGRYYVVDYKSNRLGEHREAYDEGGLRAAMDSHHYAFQYLIYAVALRRLLRQRLGPSGAAAFGGVRYLFLRGMAPDSTLGIFADAPDPALLDALDRCFSPEVR